MAVRIQIQEVGRAFTTFEHRWEARTLGTGWPEHLRGRNGASKHQAVSSLCDAIKRELGEGTEFKVEALPRRYVKVGSRPRLTIEG